MGIASFSKGHPEVTEKEYVVGTLKDGRAPPPPLLQIKAQNSDQTALFAHHTDDGEVQHAFTVAPWPRITIGPTIFVLG